MIIVLEGVNGTGKSTYARALADGLNAAIIRPFRQGPGHHFTGDTAIERDLKAFGVPYNTHVDELYTADMLSRLWKARQRVSIVLDRSVGSSVAYGDVGLGDAGKLLKLWSTLLGSDVPLLYVWLTATWSVASARLALDGRMPTEAGAEALHYQRHRRFMHVFQLVTYKKMEIITDVTLVHEGVKRILAEAR